MKPLTRRDVLTGAAVVGAASLGVSTAAGKAQTKKQGPQPNAGPPVASKAGPDDHGPREMFAVVDARGKLRRSMHVASVAYLGTGLYEVIFRRDVRCGVYLATIGGHGWEGLPAVGYVSVEGRSTNPRGVVVSTFNSERISGDMGFHLLVVCPDGYA
jgi:hypothetical protein